MDWEALIIFLLVLNLPIYLVTISILWKVGRLEEFIVQFLERRGK